MVIHILIQRLELYLKKTVGKMGDSPILEQKTSLQVDNGLLQYRIVPMLNHNEIVLSYVVAHYDGVSGVLAATNQRVLYRNSITTMKIGYSDISLVEHKASWFSKKIKIRMLSGDEYFFANLRGPRYEVLSRIKQQIPATTFIITRGENT